MSNDHLAANRANWDDRVEGHLADSEYRVDELVANPDFVSREVAFAVAEMGSVRGVRLAHLQCHIGTDTISMARLGAKVTGLDFSPRSIEAASALARDCGVDARFVLGDVHDAPALLGEQFDVVYTGVGSLCWLPDVRRWAAAAAACVRPGGLLYLHEVHPTVQSLGDDWRPDGPRLEFPYFETPEPDAFDTEASYTGTGPPHPHPHVPVEPRPRRDPHRPPRRGPPHPLPPRAHPALLPSLAPHGPGRGRLVDPPRRRGPPPNDVLAASGKGGVRVYHKPKLWTPAYAVKMAVQAGEGKLPAFTGARRRREASHQGRRAGC